MRKRWALLMAASMVLTCTACNNTDTKKTTEAPDTTAAETEVETEAETEVQTEAEIVTEDGTAADGDALLTYFSLNMGTADGMKSISVYDNGDGTVHVDYTGEEKKVTDMDASVFAEIAEAFEKTELEALNGQSVYEEGDDVASMYISYDNDTYVTADYSGKISEEYLAGYEAMDEYFQILLEETPVYIPQPIIGEGVNEEALNAMLEILDASGIENVDALMINDVPVDENFGFGMGLSKTDGIVSGTSCATMMMAQAYSFVIATVEDEKAIEAVRKDFEDNLDGNWNKWVCVSASDAMIAQKDNMVVCLMGFEEMFDVTADGIKESGWTEIETFENPNM